MSGAAAVSRLPVTVTSFPGFALMIESMNMAVMMELPMVIVLAQRLGPATGTATCGAQGDIALLKGMISGGFAIPTLCISSLHDCWNLSAEALRVAVSLRSPVVLLTSKEMVMTQQDLDLNDLPAITPQKCKLYAGADKYQQYATDSRGVPEFLPLGNETQQVRLTASTHDENSIIRHTSPAALAVSRRLHEKVVRNLPDYSHYLIDEEPQAEALVVAFDVSSGVARKAVKLMRRQGKRVSLLIPKTLFPVNEKYFDIIDRYKKVIWVEENLTGQYLECLFGTRPPRHFRRVLSFGRMIAPQDIMKEADA